MENNTMARKIKAHSVYGEWDSNEKIEQETFRLHLELIEKCNISYDILEYLNSLVVKYGDELVIVKNRGRNEDIDLKKYTKMTVDEIKLIKDPMRLRGMFIYIEIEKYVPESKMLNEERIKEAIKHYRASLNEVMEMRLFGDERFTIEELDKLAKEFDPIFDKKIIKSFPEEFCDKSFLDNRPSVPCYYTLLCRNVYIDKVGFSVITEPLADKLAEYLKGKQCLEIMAGRGVLSKVLQDRGIDIVATDDYSWKTFMDTSEPWTKIEQLEAGDAIRKYKNVSHIIVSWMPMDAPSRRIIRMIRKYNPNAKLIVIGEDGGGCTSNDDWFERVEECFDIDFIASKVKPEMFSWWGIHDRIELCEVTKPWLSKNKESIEGELV